MGPAPLRVRIALVGDHDEAVIAHRAIPRAVALTAEALGVDAKVEWIATEAVEDAALRSFDAIWCVPASPYRSMDGALTAIRFARENDLPFLGTCGGFQHAVLEFARNVLGHGEADNAEVNPDAAMPLISALSCSLVEKTDAIHVAPGSFAFTLYQKATIEEAYHCSFGLNAKYLPIFEKSAMRFTGSDDSGEPRIFEVADRRFYLGTAFQPERSALKDRVHPVIAAFVETASRR